ncbi:Metallo-dependent phosphatase-like protein [Syncephalis fuscata]|nr:Metallo-dependent phosphatase-like protein [Syncephalis fuscata]
MPTQRQIRMTAIVWLPLSILAWICGYQLDSNARDTLTPDKLSLLARKPETSLAPRWPNDTAIIGDQPDNILYFMQISDLHISRYHTVGGVAHLMHFLQTTLPLVSPSFVLVTGDLTDAKSERVLAGVQFEDEWQTYHRLLKSSGVLDKAEGKFWHDLRGNHDCFSVNGWKDKNNYYRQYGASPHDGGWSFDVKRSFGNYSFVAIDGCPQIGTGRLYNFFGYVDTNEMNQFAQALDESRTSQHTFLLSHYPVTTTVFGITSDGRTFDELSRGISMYLCGHLHRLAGGLGDMLQGYKPSGFMELELPDLKLTASYRILAIDHDMISITDQILEVPEIPMPIISAELPEKQPSSPVILITNPKDARYLMPDREPISRIARSTHIRALIFADTDLPEVTVYVDGIMKGNMKYSGRGSRDGAPGEYIPLWTVPWSADEYNDQQPHELRIVATDTQGRVGEDTVLFRVDGHREELDVGLSGLIIHSNFESLFRRWFSSIFIIVTLSLLLPQLHLSYLAFCGETSQWRDRSLASLQRTQSMPMDYLHQRLLMLPQIQLLRWRHRLYAVADHSMVWTAIYGHFLWIICLPLCPALLFFNTDLGVSWVYLYGVWVDHRWIPMLDTWGIPTIQLGLLEIWVLAYIVVAVGDMDLATSFAAKHPIVARPYSRKLIVRLCVIFCLFLQGMWHMSAWRIGRWPSVVGGIGTFWWVCTQTLLVWRYGFSATVYRRHIEKNSAKAIPASKQSQNNNDAHIE